MLNLAIYCDRQDKHGNNVRGHYIRCNALAQKWTHGEVRFLSSLHEQIPEQIILIDSWRRQPDRPDKFQVVITDKQELSVNSPNIVINHNYKAEEIRYTAPTQLLGSHWFLRRSEFEGVPVKNNDTVVVIPGGATKNFWAQINILKVQLLCNQFNYRLIISGNHTPLELANVIAQAKIIICTPSVVSFEALSLGKHVLLVKTAEDQELNYRNLQRDLLAYKFNLQQLKYELTTEGNSPRIDGIFAQNGAQKVVNKIFEVYNAHNS